MKDKKSLPLVSVVTPVYNGEKYIAECIESVLSQTYTNWEYIIVNNCSTDRTYEIALKYSKNDKRIRIHNNTQLLDVLQNHNNAFNKISPDSKYCKIVQADDWLFPECIEKMVEVAEANPDVGIVSSYRLEETEVSCDGLPYPSTVVSGREICRQSLVNGLYVFGSPTTILIRSDLIRSRKYYYNERNLHADVEACFSVLKDHDFGFVHQVLSFTRRHNETGTAFAKRIKTYYLSNLYLLKTYGPIFLNQNEYEELFNRKLKEYYRFLGRNLLRNKDNEFWNYHLSGIKEIDCNFHRYILWREFMISSYNKILDRVLRKLKIK